MTYESRKLLDIFRGPIGQWDQGQDKWAAATPSTEMTLLAKYDIG
jgi:hypothetical protein